MTEKEKKKNKKIYTCLSLNSRTYTFDNIEAKEKQKL